MRKILSVLFFFCQLSAWAQLQEPFSDGDLSQNPPWSGDLHAFIVHSGQLQSNGPAQTPGVVQLRTSCRAAIGTTWEFFARLDLATSAANHADVFLLATEADLQQAQGYFVRLGGTPDEVSLFREDRTGPPAYVINGRDGTLNKSTANVVRVKVNRSIRAEWTLWIDLTGTGMHYTEEGRAADALYQQSAFMGVLLRYSAANRDRFFFDDFLVADLEAPVLSQVYPMGARSLAIQFNEALAFDRLANHLFYVSNGPGSPVTVEADSQDPAVIYLHFDRDFAPGASQLTITQVADLFGNRVTDVKADFVYTPPVVASYRDVRINEVLADDDPSQGLPQAEFIELYNTSAKAFDLKGWKVADAASTAATLPAYQLLPGAYLILCRPADILLFQAYGPVLGLPAFPSLNDGADVVRLSDARGKLIDRISYRTTWYQDAQKTQGGWSLELINPLTPCGDAANYKAAVHPAGGTPGLQNSVFDTTPDSQPPQLVTASVLSDKHIRLVFSEALDSLSANNPGHYALSPSLPLATVSVLAPAFQEVLLDLQESLQPRQVYTLRLDQLRDCAGNPFAGGQAISLVLPEPATVGDVVINEVLFNPRPGGVDFVEIVNRSPKYIDLANWQLANGQADSAAGQQSISRQPLILAPQQYLVLTSRPEVVWRHYVNSRQEAFQRLAALPAYPDHAGSVVLQNAAGMVIDRFDYHEDMHFALLDDRNGVSLERIRVAGDSSRANWHSAASPAGFATPGYRNSQQHEATSGNKLFQVEPKAFSPDGDGDRDFATISYQTEANGWMASITIYDAEGREVRRLVKNELLATKGFFRWDGLNEQGQKAAIGYYVLFIELFRSGSPVKVFKETLALGARF